MLSLNTFLSLKPPSDGKSGKITSTTGGEAEFHSDFVQKIQDILDRSHFTDLPSAPSEDVNSDMGYGVPALHIKFRGMFAYQLNFPLNYRTCRLTIAIFR